MRVLIEHMEFVLCVDRDDRVIRDGAVIVENDRIIDLGGTAEVLARHREGAFDQVIDGRRRGACPRIR